MQVVEVRGYLEVVVEFENHVEKRRKEKGEMRNSMRDILQSIFLLSPFPFLIY
jgi:hypothetical protein